MRHLPRSPRLASCGLVIGLIGLRAAACPFCDVVAPPLAERRDAAAAGRLAWFARWLEHANPAVAADTAVDLARWRPRGIAPRPSPPRSPKGRRRSGRRSTTC